MFLRILITYFFFFNFFLNAYANEKEIIINRLLEIKNFSFNFKQISQNKTETGNCLLEFDRKLKCHYTDKLKKEITINNKTLVVWQKKYNKIYFYPISKSPFLNILTKNKLITLIQKSNLVVNQNIKLVYLDENEKKITVLFEKKNYELIGWLIEDEFQNEVNFSLQIENINNKISKNYFKVPSPN